MSRGLGKLQRDILNTLEEAKQDMFNYTGSYRQENIGNYKGWKWDRPGWVVCRNRIILLADHVYDLRASMKYLAAKQGQTYCRGNYTNGKFQAAFSRAVKGLIARGLIEPLGLVPIVDYRASNQDHEYSSVIMNLSDGLYLNINKRQNRFIVKCYV